MSTKVLFATILVMSIALSTTLAAPPAFNVGSANGAFYFFGGPPQSNGGSASFGSAQAGGSGSQQASAFTPGGIGIVGQYAHAMGNQVHTPGVKLQVMNASMCEGAVKVGGTGYVIGAQSGAVHMNQPTYGSLQGNYAAGTQRTAMLGAGYGTASQTMCIGTTQVQTQ